MEPTSDDLTGRLKKTLDGREAPALSADLVTDAADRTAPHMVNPRRRALTGGALTIAVAAVTVGALVVTAPTQQGPLFAAAASSSTTAGSATSDVAEGDQRMMAWVNYEYLPGTGLSTATGTGHVYQLHRAGTPEDTLRTAAAALGLTGEPTKSEYYDPAYPTYVIGKEDGSAPSVVVSWTGSGDWWYNDPSAYPQYDNSCETTIADDSEQVSENPAVCEVTAPEKSLAPSEADARTKAQAIFAATGLTVDPADIRITADEWQITAAANLVVDGQQTALEWGVSWSSTGAMSYAYGHSVSVLDKGSYSTVSAKDAVERLADWRWGGSAGPDYQGGAVLYASDTMRAGALEGDSVDGAGTDGEPSTEPTTEPATEPTGEPSVDPTEPTDEPTAEPTAEPTDEPTLEPQPEPTPETVVVTIDEAHATLLMMWDSEGNVWLVPGFAMAQPGGWFSAVVSLVDGVITLPEPTPIEPFTDDVIEP
jgi:hypothetical protein